MTLKKLLAAVFIASLAVLPLNTGLIFAEDATSDQLSNVAVEQPLPDTPVTDSNGNVVNPGILPDSPLYWFTNLLDQLQLLLATSPVQKVQITERHALEKLAEAHAMNKKGNAEAVQSALENYAAKISQAQSFIEQLKDPNSEDAKKLSTALAQDNSKNIQVLSSLLDKLPPQAAQKVSLNIVRSMEKALDKQAKSDDSSAPEAQRSLAKELEGTATALTRKAQAKAPTPESKEVKELKSLENSVKSKASEVEKKVQKQRSEKAPENANAGEAKSEKAEQAGNAGRKGKE